jgi:hypothetical protein
MAKLMASPTETPAFAARRYHAEIGAGWAAAAAASLMTQFV